jgi:hypothetical protein
VNKTRMLLQLKNGGGAAESSKSSSKSISYVRSVANERLKTVTYLEPFETLFLHQDLLRESGLSAYLVEEKGTLP